jgi:hypothetical protein
MYEGGYRDAHHLQRSPVLEGSYEGLGNLVVRIEFQYTIS